MNNVAWNAVREGRYADYLVNNVDVYMQSPRRARTFLDDAQYERLIRLYKEHHGTDLEKAMLEAEDNARARPDASSK